MLPGLAVVYLATGLASSKGLLQQTARQILHARPAIRRCAACVRCRFDVGQQEPVDAPLPAGWQELTDPASGRSYYVSPAGESTWYRPGVQAAPPPATTAAHQDDMQLGGIIAADQNPYVSSKASRMRAKFGDNTEGIMTPAQEAKRTTMEDGLAADLARFKAEDAAKRGPQRAEDEGPSLLQNVINTLGTVLTYNFFIICTFFLWFLVGAGQQLGLKETTIIDTFRSFWDWLIMPLLTTHMTLTFLSYGLEKLATAGDEEA